MAVFFDVAGRPAPETVVDFSYAEGVGECEGLQRIVSIAHKESLVRVMEGLRLSPQLKATYCTEIAPFSNLMNASPFAHAVHVVHSSIAWHVGGIFKAARENDRDAGVDVVAFIMDGGLTNSDSYQCLSVLEGAKRQSG